ncbi:MAG: hypothetical protein LBH98_04535 [Chitinispirillales bacterium]|jgi:ribonuclease D|nr:hypothetical protein [Chitinispirillales bacterium]
MIPNLIDTLENCDLLFEALKKEPIVAMDTEFVWRRSYYPFIGIIQIGVSREKSFIIDTVKLNECPESFRIFLENEKIMKVCHDAYQDIQIINNYAKVTTKNVLDTQLTAAFTGFGKAVSLSELIEKVQGVSLTKTQTLTNWLNRPLTDAQIEYALDDVRYLTPCIKFLLKIAQKNSVIEWILQDCEELSKIDEPFSLFAAVEKSYLREMYGVSFSNREKLYRLCYAVEIMARNRNLPRSFLFKHGQLGEIINCNPENPQNLKKTTLSHKNINRYASFISDNIKNKEIPVDEDLIKRSVYSKSKYSTQIGLITKEIGEIFEKTANEKGISVSRIYNRKQLSQLVCTTLESGSAVSLSGWRNIFLGGIWNDFWTDKLKRLNYLEI